MRLHYEETDHQKKAETYMKNTTLPGATPTLGHTSISDRVAELRCVTASFISEHTLLFSVAEKLATSSPSMMIQ